MKNMMIIVMLRYSIADLNASVYHVHASILLGGILNLWGVATINCDPSLLSSCTCHRAKFCWHRFIIIMTQLCMEVKKTGTELNSVLSMNQWTRNIISVHPLPLQKPECVQQYLLRNIFSHHLHESGKCLSHKLIPHQLSHCVKSSLLQGLVHISTLGVQSPPSTQGRTGLWCTYIVLYVSPSHPFTNTGRISLLSPAFLSFRWFHHFFSWWASQLASYWVLQHCINCVIIMKVQSSKEQKFNLEVLRDLQQGRAIQYVARKTNNQ